MTESKRKRTPTVINPLQDTGKLPPQAVELEESVLGACLLEASAVESVIGFLSPAVFYKEQNMQIFNTVLKLYREGEPIDILTVTNS